MFEPGLIIASTQQAGAAAGGGEPALEPLVTIDFKNGVYEWGGDSHTLGETVEENTDFGGSYDASMVVNEIGLTSESGCSPVLKAGVEALLITDGFTAVIDFENASSNAWLKMAELPTNTQDMFVQTSGDGPLDVYAAGTNASDNGAHSTGAHKIAVTMLPASMKIVASIDGEAIISVDESASPIFNTIGFSIGPDSILRSAIFYAPQDDADLPGLSAL